MGGRALPGLLGLVVEPSPGALPRARVVSQKSLAFHGSKKAPGRGARTEPARPATAGRRETPALSETRHELGPRLGPCRFPSTTFPVRFHPPGHALDSRWLRPLWNPLKTSRSPQHTPPSPPHFPQRRRRARTTLHTSPPGPPSKQGPRRDGHRAHAATRRHLPKGEGTPRIIPRVLPTRAGTFPTMLCPSPTFSGVLEPFGRTLENNPPPLAGNE